ncbi:hypothetical protein HID58_017961 [Brassica napus]|uniref:BnaA05g11610D protein n=2 Tax=Brassica napus TaxID=3708 RepID=A0A078F8H9_BRANA|nr:uncharacterized protein LOC125575061 isoform X1 [Brassica napus]XP_048636784.1 uncharacterized protein LOC125575061 isoform X1 [Brassica napus]XP_048636785.1 uncharacterized protein LOC125575061 isoform X1 [Brassica napus]KAH0925705.1 hypothetical protein HID58_017961 [Brassica napus]CAF2096464.1 unnamed protein product [Brassica napus]CDY10775.1 BnaA05g11610D [Brassica napus]
MDFKGITWVGNVYHKFEAMCLEVEEIIVQDTAKYVESQVQTVGNSLKKFCSDVVQDFNPDETLDSEKQLPVSILHEYAPVCSSFKKKRDSMNQQTRDVKQEQEGKKDVFDVKFRGVDADDYDICTSPRQYSYGSPYRRTQLGRKQVTLKDSSSISSMVHRARVKHDVGTVKSSDPPPGGVVARLISKDKCQKGDRSKGQHGLRVVDSVRSHESELRTKNDHGLGVADSVRIQDSEIQPSVATSLPAGSDDCRKETDEDSTQTKFGSSSVSESEQKAEILQQLSGRSVEESCIIVDRDELHCVFSDMKENDKHKPYKKIRDAISSRMKQNREKEYKRLARQWYAEDVENGRECGDSSKQIEEDQSPEESEWEFL